MKTQSTIKIELTPEQKEQLKQLTGRNVPQVKFNLEQLEERVAPVATQN